VAVAAGDVWVSLRDAGSVVRVDGDSVEELERIPVDRQPWPVAAGGGFVWVATGAGRLLRIDPAKQPDHRIDDGGAGSEIDRCWGGRRVGREPVGGRLADRAVPLLTGVKRPDEKCS